jgi:glycosyltransferase involved in cell wall biosynthesis
MLLTKDAETDPRVLRESGKLTDAGYTVEVYYRKRSSNERLPHTILSNIAWWVSALKFARTNRHLAVHAHDLDTLPIGLLMAKLKGVPCVYDAHESFPDMVIGAIPYGLTRLLSVIERRLTKHVDHVVLANVKIGPLVSDEPSKWVVVMNCPGVIEVNPASKREKVYTLGYFGSLERGRFLQGLVATVKQMPNWRLLIAGSGKLKVDVSGSDNIIYLGQLKPEQVGDMMAGCDLLSVIFEEGNPNDYIGTPNRLFEAMALGVPVVANWHTYSGEIVTKTDCGFTLDPCVPALKTLLEYLERNPLQLLVKGENGSMAWAKEYNSSIQGAKLVSLYDSIKVTE